MALNITITGLIGTAQLRNEIGGPSKDTADPGYISDLMLEGVIQRHHDEAVEMAERIAAERVEKTGTPGPYELFEQITFAVLPSVNHPGLWETTIPALYYPRVAQVVDEEEHSLYYDENIVRTVKTAFVPRYVYKIVGTKIYVNPDFEGDRVSGDIHCHVVEKTELYNHLISGDVLNSLNEQIVKDATAMLDKRVKEGTRLEQVFKADDGVIGDMS